MTQFSVIPTSEARELAEDVRALFEDLAASLPHERRASSGEYRATVDVVETEEAVEVTVDVSGIPADALRVLFRAGVLLIAGEKVAPLARTDQTFHLVEREFGRFARAVHLEGSFDIAAARATVNDGELSIILPKRADRRNQAHRIAITPGRAG